MEKRLPVSKEALLAEFSDFFEEFSPEVLLFCLESGIISLEDFPLIVANHLCSWLLTCGRSSFSYSTRTPRFSIAGGIDFLL